MGFSMFDIIGAQARRGGGLGGLGGLGALTVYPAVGRLQRGLNAVLAEAKRLAALPPPVGRGAGTSFVRANTIGTGGQYGQNTHGLLKRWIDWYVAVGLATGVSSGDLNLAGPEAIRTELLAGFSSLSSADIFTLQQAWQEWKTAPAAPPPDPGDGGPPAPPPGDETAPPPAAPGMSTGKKVLIGLGIAGGLALLGWAIFGDHDD